MRLDQRTLLLYQERAENGDAGAAYNVAKHYSFGVQDSVEAEHWLLRAVELGELRACSGLLAYRTTPLPEACNHQAPVSRP